MKASGRSENTAPKRRVWRKLHLAVDPVTHDIVAAVDPVTHDIVAAEASLENVHDAEVLPTLLNPLQRKLGRVYADGAYDSKASHPANLAQRGDSLYPARKNAGLWEKGHPRNEAVLVMRKEGLAHWKKISGYHRRSLAGNGDIGSSSCWQGESVCVTTMAKWEKSWRMSVP